MRRLTLGLLAASGALPVVALLLMAVGSFGGLAAVWFVTTRLGILPPRRPIWTHPLW